MDLIGKLAQGGCAADGTVAARNPLSQALDGVMRAGPMGHAPQQIPANAPQGQYVEQDLRRAMEEANRMHGQSFQSLPMHQNMPSMHMPSQPQMDFNHVWQNQHMQHGAMQNQMDQAFHSAVSAPQIPEQQLQHHNRSFVPMQQFSHPPPFMQGMYHQPQGGHMMPSPMQYQNPVSYEPHQQQAPEVQYEESKTAPDAQHIANKVADTMRENSDPRFQKSEFLNFMNQVGSGKAEINDAENTVIHHGPADQDQLADLLDKDLSLNDALDTNALEEIWAKAMQEGQMMDPFEDTSWGQETSQLTYEFAEENPYMSESNSFEVGCALFRDGNLKDAIFAFEAVLQETPDHSEAWRMLGECHAENDQDKEAIVCLNRAVEEDPYNLEALLALGVSNVNELKSHGALTTLQAWVQHNPKFHGLQVQMDEDAYGDGSLMDEVMQLMLKAQAYDPEDSDVQVVLGVLYNVSKDYDAAVRCFRAAASARPEEYTLWNKLGATLANSSRSNEAIPTYHRALEIKPKYARGWLNLGISHANLGQYEDAAQCYLQALQQNNQADHIWSYLRIAFTCMERFDLVKLTDMKDVGAFRDEFRLLAL